jgi:hypothetical protein
MRYVPFSARLGRGLLVGVAIGPAEEHIGSFVGRTVNHSHFVSGHLHSFI